MIPAFLLTFATVNLILIVRNFWVYNTRNKWIDDRENGYTLISYERMLFNLVNWNTDIEAWK